MKTILNTILVYMLILAFGNLNATAEGSHFEGSGKAVKTLSEAAMVFEQIMENAEIGIPQQLINQSEGLVILPATCRVAAGPFNASGGTGIAMIRSENGAWSEPFFVVIREGSLGNRIDAQVGDIVLLFRDRDDVINIEKEEIALGHDMGIAAGPARQTTSANTPAFMTEVYAYQKIEGLFTGTSLTGGILSHYARLRQSVDGENGHYSEKLFYATQSQPNRKVNELVEAIRIQAE